ncbi:DUF3991 and toprim domain-containing protein [[Clostridium] innocuum]|uniref:DUF3991 and TOPRIM domain-containing protein n=1 Tax=Clostridium innocuum TaxID=1522 RepID=UPI0014384E48|nr:DUF3991 and TOPRIM domain-containing protein [[Clostridium] innocuum]MCR0134339.1 DUF3991 and toprim domain-containing protein [[Clostridium] innocuum]MCR0163359.1 DUF3991 and toprim domain-containing protein [[Clostridium] innocuum]MCR0287592.1 DUF3991 and toprim domain-containing protein [[Clostridium] innocuum]MCR0387895.1 DUF3991 and toprim domain-containing protein [[Clostridium] innocuum]MCR0487588.1 DUF3991 and toprim domain-containing protein [[Clostridium] innocuum]
MKEIINISIPKSRFKQKIKQANGTKYSHRVILPKEAGAYRYHVLLISEDFVQEDIDNKENNVLHFYADREIQLSQHHRTPNGEDVYEKIRVMPKELYKSFYGEYKDNSRKRFSDEEIEFLKKNISVMDFLQDRAGFSFKREGHYYRCDQHSSLVIDTRNNAMFWHTEHINGSALEYLRKAEGKTFPEAMNILIEYHNGLAPDKKQYIAPKYEQIEFKLPDSQQNISKIYEYLCDKRKIDRDLIKRFVDDGKIYLDGKGNCVFACENYKGKIDSAFARSTYSNFRGDIGGGNKFTGFFIEMDPKATKLVLTEAYIDGLSYITAKRQAGEKIDFNVLACDSCNVMNETFRVNYLTRPVLNQNIDTVILASDNDKAGKAAAEDFKQFVRPFHRIQNVIDDLPSLGSDWNKDLQKMYEQPNMINETAMILNSK